MSVVKVEAGAEFVVSHPFVKSTYIEHDNEGSYEVPCWRPGVEIIAEPPDGGSGRACAHGLGFQRVRVVSVHKPASRYPERVFFVREWEDPSGRRFGKSKLRITTAAAFVRLITGYRVPYELVESGQA